MFKDTRTIICRTSELGSTDVPPASLRGHETHGLTTGNNYLHRMAGQFLQNSSVMCPIVAANVAGDIQTIVSRLQ